MKIQAAIQQLTIQRKFTNGSNAKVEAIDMAIESLKMQIAMIKHCDKSSCSECPYFNQKYSDCMNTFIININN